MVFIKPSLLVLFLVVGEISAQESRIINDSPRNRPPVLVQGGDLRNFEIFEDTPVGSTVYTLVGQDPEGSKIFYTISGDYFSADLNTGVVTLKKPLDRETIPKIDVVITIQDESIREIPENLIPFRRAVKGKLSHLFLSIHLEAELQSQPKSKVPTRQLLVLQVKAATISGISR